MKIVYLLGVDGSGKTTLSKNLVERLNREKTKAQYFYARHFPVLLYPFKFAAKKSVLKTTNEFKDYSSYHSTKTGFFVRHPHLGNIYALIWLIDYITITYFRMIRILFKNDIVIIDRYFLDVIVNISDTLNWSDEKIQKKADFIAKLFPKPFIYVYINISAEKAFARKDDIQSVKYLEDRIRKYKVLSQKFKFIHLDGEQDKEELSNSAFENIQKNISWCQ